MREGLREYQGERDEAFRFAIYRGDILHIPASEVSLRLARFCWNQAKEILGPNPLEPTPEPEDVFFGRVGQLRRHLYQSDECRRSISGMMESLGFDPREHVFDAARSRLIPVNGHRNPAAASVYYAHRDTWYANPPSQVTWWMPLHDVTVDHTFEWLPDYFDRPVQNDSQVFDYDRWVGKGKALKIGWQDSKAGQREQYPRMLESLSNARRVGFEANAGDVIVFSGQHLHQTRSIESGHARLSIDFRTIHTGDYHAARGPRNVDNRSTGDAFLGHARLSCADQSK